MDTRFERIDFDSYKQMANIVTRYPAMYAVDSLAMKGLIYGIGDGYFAFLTGKGIMRIDYTYLEDFALKLIPDVRDEVLALYEDTKFLFEANKGYWQ